MQVTDLVDLRFKGMVPPEPDSSTDFKNETFNKYSFRLKYPSMIVYEICKVNQY
jgi:hypothetical protein